MRDYADSPESESHSFPSFTTRTRSSYEEAVYSGIKRFSGRLGFRTLTNLKSMLICVAFHRSRTNRKGTIFRARSQNSAAQRRFMELGGQFERMYIDRDLKVSNKRLALDLTCCGVTIKAHHARTTTVVSTSHFSHPTPLVHHASRCHW